MSGAVTIQPSVWRNRNFRLVLIGGLVNDIGDWMLALALPIYVFIETGSGRDTAAVFLIQLVVGIAFGPYGGALADRWDLRRTIIATNLLQAVTLLPLLAVQHQRIWPVFIVAAAQGLLQQVNNPASFALVPRMVAEDQLVQANGAGATGSSIARLVGAPLGGIAVGLGGLGMVVAVDAATFLAVAVAIGFARVPTGVIDETGTSVPAEREPAGVAAGWRAIRKRPALVGYLVAQSLAGVAFAMFPVLFIKFVVVELHGGGAEIGGGGAKAEADPDELAGGRGRQGHRQRILQDIEVVAPAQGIRHAEVIGAPQWRERAVVVVIDGELDEARSDVGADGE